MIEQDSLDKLLSSHQGTRVQIFREVTSIEYLVDSQPRTVEMYVARGVIPGMIPRFNLDGGLPGIEEDMDIVRSINRRDVELVGEETSLGSGSRIELEFISYRADNLDYLNEILDQARLAMEIGLLYLGLSREECDKYSERVLLGYPKTQNDWDHEDVKHLRQSLIESYNALLPFFKEKRFRLEPRSFIKILGHVSRRNNQYLDRFSDSILHPKISV